MPRYDYECNSCADIFEVKQGFDDEPVAECPKCQSTARRIFTPVPIIFKGSGFYVTDNKNSSTPSTSKPGQERDSDKSETGKADSAKAEAPKAESEKKDSKADVSVS
jgi:putative FmdB family regulatory protein